MAKKKRGRPPKTFQKTARKGRPNNVWDREKIIAVIKEEVKLGYSNRKACINARFSYNTFEGWLVKDPELRIELEALRGSVSRKARMNKVNAIETGNLTEGHSWLVSQEREWRDKVDIGIYDPNTDTGNDDAAEARRVVAALRKLGRA